MLQDLFQPLLTIVGPTITKQSTRMIDILLADECLALTTHFLPSRNSQISLSYYSYSSRVSTILIEVPDQVWLAFKENFISFPSTKEQWIKITEDFKKK